MCTNGVCIKGTITTLPALGHETHRFLRFQDWNTKISASDHSGGIARGLMYVWSLLLSWEGIFLRVTPIRQNKTFHCRNVAFLYVSLLLYFPSLGRPGRPMFSEHQNRSHQPNKVDTFLPLLKHELLRCKTVFIQLTKFACNSI